MAAREKLRDKVCGICYASKDFRVLKCGHLACADCVETIYSNNNGATPCPWDGCRDGREPQLLPTLKQCSSKMFYNSTQEIADFTRILQELIEQRKITIQHLRDIADFLMGIERKCAVSKIAGSATGITGTALTVTGLGISVTGVGAAVGVPMAIAGAVIGVTGGATTGVSAVVEAVTQRKGLRRVQEDLDRDRSLATEAIALLQNANLLNLWHINPALVANLGRILPAIAKVGLTSAAGAQMALGLLRTAAVTGIHFAGFALAIAVIPFDLRQMIISSIKIHKKKPSAVVKELNDMADTLEHQLRSFLVMEENFKLVYTIDGYWAYIEVKEENKLLFEAKLEQGCAVDELEEFGEIVESGEDEVPEEVKKRMQDEWYSHCEDEDEPSLEELDFLDTDMIQLLPKN